ncbi:hypothetical protein APY04_0188 [Hyphomicrobium sulfonivorans]|uniref:Uncharacterized protein n=1 Tax=Hyphomicrobium sulfonivorans TaxID=121290 RepID=A0A109BP54_HYPSL|nr:hypothetical protein APY04_0188 [Hyphomicrobium sulfonivorans]
MRVAEMARGFFWSCDDEYGFAPTIEQAKSRAEATCRHRHWFGERRRHLGNEQSDAEIRLEVRAARLWGDDYAS